MLGFTFDAPRHKLIVHRSTFVDDTKRAAKPKRRGAAAYESIVRQHVYNNQIELFIAPPPSPLATASAAAGGAAPAFPAFGSAAVYYRVTTSIVTLIGDRTFVDRYLRRTSQPQHGGLALRSIGTALDHSPLNVSLTSIDGVLRLSVDRDLYEQLGLVGVVSAFAPAEQRWNIGIDVCAESFVPGEKLYDRVVRCLAADRIPALTFVVAPLQSSDRIEFPPAAGTVLQFPLSAVTDAFGSPPTAVAAAAAASDASTPQRFTLRALPALDTVHDTVTRLSNAADARTKSNPASIHRIRPLDPQSGAVTAAHTTPANSPAPELGEIDSIIHELLDWCGALACRTTHVLQFVPNKAALAPPTATPTASAVWPAPPPVSALSTKPSLSKNNLKLLTAQLQANKPKPAAAAAANADFMSLRDDSDGDGGGSGDTKADTKVDTKVDSKAAVAVTTGAAAPASASALDSYACAFAFQTLPFRAVSGGSGGDARAFRWRGLVLPSHVESTLTYARAMVDTGRAGWCTVMVWGFADTNVSWLHSTASPPKTDSKPNAAGSAAAMTDDSTDSNAASNSAAKPKEKRKPTARQREQRAAHALAATEHEYSGSGAGMGENDYLIVVLPERRYWLYVLTTGLDTFQ